MLKKFLKNFENSLKKCLKIHENFEKISTPPQKLSKILKNFQKTFKNLWKISKNA
jgi:recombination DNA repair RAD52 pathway protein